MGRLGRAGIGLAVALAALVAGCTDDGAGSVLVDLKTDWAPGIEFHSVRVVLEDPRTGRPMMETRPVSRSQDFIAGVRVAELGLSGPGTYAIETELLNTAGTVIASRRTSSGGCPARSRSRSPSSGAGASRTAPR